MAWFTLDIFLAYVVRGVIRVFLYFSTGNWSRSMALILRARELGPGWGCTSVKLDYRFNLNGVEMEGSDIKPFLSGWHSSSHAKSFTHNVPRTIRVNPKNPQQTHFFEMDQ